MAIRNLVVITAGFISFALLLHFAQPVSSLIVRMIWPSQILFDKAIGEITDISGTVERQSAADPAMQKVTNAEKVVRHRDRFITRTNSHLTINLENGYVFRIEPSSEVFLELWESSDPGRESIYISVLEGDFALLNSGQPGSMYVLQDKKVFTPEVRPGKRTEILTIDTNTNVSAEPRKQKPLAELPSTATPPAAELPTEKSTLDTPYIEKVLASRDELFRRCRLTSLRDQQADSGNLIYTFVIEGSGQVAEVKLLQSDISNQKLQSCVASVIERTRFRSFAGPSINLSYPIRFE